ncbi:plasmid partitioning protein RepB [Pseudoroseomonas globiformis]|uniref:Plasmid partitioning protein RepB n=1 Tax=Teichococcus globiformis TaxID=2307229 RepID=A0ABV7G7C2_9PROT
MARKNLLAGLTGPKLTAVNNEAQTVPSGGRSGFPFSGRGAVGAVTRSIDDLAAKAQAARELEAKLTSGQVIVELDPASIDASFVADRMAQDDEEYDALRDSIAKGGQDSPILVRPHPQVEGRYQVAFGHRRLRAALDLRQPVRAVVRTLSDRELVLAQGQENSARANLSFIERARFAHRLEEGGYDRETIMQALSADKTTVSRLITVVQRIPSEVIDAIGPAPATGRDRWVELASAFQNDGAPSDWQDRLATGVLRDAPSDERFLQVMAWFDQADALPSARPAQDPRTEARRDPSAAWIHSSGAPVLQIRKAARTTLLSIDNRVAPGFDAFLVEQMEELFSSFLREHSSRDGKSRSRRRLRAGQTDS